MKTPTYLLASLVLVSTGLSGQIQPKETPDKLSPKIPAHRRQSALIDPQYGHLSINNLTSWHRSDGSSNRSPGGSWGSYFPKRVSEVIYGDWFLWGGEVFSDASFASDTIMGQLVRVGGARGLSGTLRGSVSGVGSQAVPEDTSSFTARMFRVRRDYFFMTDEQVRDDASLVFELDDANAVTQGQLDAVRMQYAQDWTTWPADKGAPFIDRNGNGVYDAPPAFSFTFTPESLLTGGFDEPGIGSSSSPADQVLWTVYNDLDTTTARNLFGSYPIGLEVQKTVWAYDRSGPLGDAYLTRYRIVNVGGVDTSDAPGDQLGSFWVKNMYVGQGGDIDIYPGFTDDLKGCDTLLNLGYVYDYGSSVLPGLVAPAVGYDLLAGPSVVSPGDSAVRRDIWMNGYRNLGMTGFDIESTGDSYSSPSYGPENYTRGTGIMWKVLRGFAANGDLYSEDSHYWHPPEIGPSPFPYSGDPLTGSGWLDGSGEIGSGPPNESRIVVTSGPFDLAPGDTQDVYVATIGGVGADRLSSISVLKTNSRAIQGFFDDLLTDPPAIQAEYAVEHPNARQTRIALTLSPQNAADVQSITVDLEPENGSEPSFSLDVFDDGAHGDGLAGDGVWAGSRTVQNRTYPYRATARVQTNADPIYYHSFLSGLTLRPMPVLENWRVVWENGRQDKEINSNETVVLRFDVRNTDSSRALKSLQVFNGSAPASGFGSRVQVADSIAPGATLSSDELLLSLEAGRGESEFIRFTIVLQGNAASGVDTLGIAPWSPLPTWRDTIPTLSIRGAAWVTPVVVDPAQISGHDYAVSYKYTQSSPDEVVWSVHDLATGSTVVTDAPLWPGDPVWPHPIVDGIQFIVSDLQRDIADIRVTANAAGPIAGAEPGALGSMGFPTPGSGDPTSAQQTTQARWAVHTGVPVPTGERPSTYADFSGRGLRGGDILYLVPYDWEIRFTQTGGWAFMAFQDDVPIQVPFELWNLGVGTPENTSDDFRLIPYVFDADSNGVFNLNNADHPASPNDNDPATDWIYWIVPWQHTDLNPPMAHGTAGYDAFVSTINASTSPPSVNDRGLATGQEVLARMSLINLDGSTAPLPDPSFPAGVNQTMPETGTIFRITTTKPNFPGDSTIVRGSVLAGIGSGEVPLTYGLEQNYPNPFNPTTNFEFRIADLGLVKISVYEVLGRRVAELVNEEMPPGIHTATWNASAFSSGIYFYRLEVRGGGGLRFVETKKMVLIR